MSVLADAEANSARKRRAALASVAASVALAVLKLASGAASGSLALISEGAHNALDIAASGLTLIAVREADRPADEDHPFGHAKIESVAALIETGALLALAVGVAVFAALRLTIRPAAVDPNVFALGAILGSIVVDLWRSLTLSRVARETGSDALAADALHFSSDLVSSLCVLAGLVATRFGARHADAFAAIAVALFIAVAAARLGRRTIDTLVDTAPKGLSKALSKVVEETPGVAGVEFLRLRRSGARIVGDLGVLVPRTLSLERVAAIKSALIERIGAQWPEAALTITANPRALDDETLRERVALIAARRRLSIHHVVVQRLEGRAVIALDLEVDGRMRIADAHDVASRFEAAIAEELGADVEVSTHIEPIDARETEGHDADPALTQSVARSLARHAAADGRLTAVHDVRVRLTPNGPVAIFHCEIEPAVSVSDAHEAVDALERAAKLEHPSLSRIAGHVEPAGGRAA